MKSDKRLLVIFIIIFQAIIIVFLDQFIYINNQIKNIKNILPFINLVILILTGFIIFSIKEIGQDIKNKLEINLIKSHLNHVESLLKSQLSQKHEYARHIQTVQSMIYLGEIDSAKEYIEGISENYRPISDIIYIQNPAFTVLLNSKRQVADMKGIKFDFAIKCNLNDIKITSWDLDSVLGNLIDNAFEAVMKNRSIKNVGLEIKFEEKEYRMYVYNNGPKISNKEMQNIFKPGYSTKGSEGRGYGLYIIKKIVDRYEGKIEVLSNKKTVFIIHLPCKDGIKND